MTAKTHILGGVTLSLATISITNLVDSSLSSAVQSGIMLGASAIGAIAPDIDHTGSKISRMNIGNRIASFFVQVFFSHRGITHSPFFLVILSVLLGIGHLIIPYILTNMVVLGFIIGYTSHLFLDMLNPGGIPLLYPFIKKKVSIGNIRTRSLLEAVFYVILLVIAVMLAYPICMKFPLFAKFAMILS